MDTSLTQYTTGRPICAKKTRWLNSKSHQLHRKFVRRKSILHDCSLGIDCKSMRDPTKPHHTSITEPTPHNNHLGIKIFVVIELRALSLNCDTACRGNAIENSDILCATCRLKRKRLLVQQSFRRTIIQLSVGDGGCAAGFTRSDGECRFPGRAEQG